MWLKVEPSKDSRVTLTWGNEAGPYVPTFSVGQATLAQAAKKIRDTLELVARLPPIHAASDRHRLLARLAKQGAELQFLIFDCPEQKDDVIRLKQWIADERMSGDNNLSIIADPTFNIPWGLAFDGNSDIANTGTGSLDEYQDFWCLKYTLSMIFAARTQLRRRKSIKKKVKLLSVVNADVLDALKANSQEGDKKYTEVAKFLSQPVGVAFDIEHCDNLIKKANESDLDVVLYFFGHCKNGSLLLREEQIDVIKFKIMLDGLLDHSGTNASSAHNLVFLNACETMAGDFDNSFRDSVVRPGLSGLIATESSVPRDFAADFGLRILRSMLQEGESLGNVMHKLRHDSALWPWSLLYACYAPSDYRTGDADGSPGGEAKIAGEVESHP